MLRPSYHQNKKPTQKIPYLTGYQVFCLQTNTLSNDFCLRIIMKKSHLDSVPCYAKLLFVEVLPLSFIFIFLGTDKNTDFRSFINTFKSFCWLQSLKIKSNFRNKLRSLLNCSNNTAVKQRQSSVCRRKNRLNWQPRKKSHSVVEIWVHKDMSCIQWLGLK